MMQFSDMIESTKNLLKWIRSPHWIILLFSFSMPLSSQLNVKVLIAALAVVFLAGNFKKVGFKIVHRTWDVTFYLLVLAVGLAYSSNIVQGLKVLETSFSLVALLIIVNLYEKFDEEYIHRALMAFVLGLVLACFICLGYAIYRYMEFKNLRYFFYYELTDIIHSHPTYFAYYLIASITYCLYLLFNEVRRKHQIILAGGVVLFFSILMLTGGRTAYVSLLLIFSFFILKYILEERSESKTISFVLVTLLLIGLFWLNNVDYLKGELMSNNDYWERTALWKAAINANPNPFLGVGTGDHKSVLNEYYKVHGMNEFITDSYNSHNQFIQLYFSNGILGLLSLVILIGRPLYLSTIDQNVLGVLLIFPFIIYGVTEVFLGRYQGVVFFALLHQMFISQHYSNRLYKPLKQA